MVQFTCEFTTNHMGNFNVLMRMVEKAVETGADYIKMQKKDVATFYSPEKLAAPYESPYGQTYRDYRSIFEFDAHDFHRFDEKCQALGIDWFSTVQDAYSLDFLLDFDLPLYKVASVNARNQDFLKALAERIPSDKWLVISVAGSTLEQVEATLSLFPDHHIHVLHCVAQYPCPVENLRLGNIPVLKREFEDDRIRIGYSGHEEGIAPSLAAIALGAELVERHFCLSRHSFVHHIECSLEPDEFTDLVRIARGGEGLDRYLEELPEVALQSNFGMSAKEKSFLVDNQYGRKFLKEKSRFRA